MRSARRALLLASASLEFGRRLRRGLGLRLGSAAEQRLLGLSRECRSGGLLLLLTAAAAAIGRLLEAGIGAARQNDRLSDPVVASMRSGKARYWPIQRISAGVHAAIWPK